MQIFTPFQCWIQLPVQIGHMSAAILRIENGFVTFAKDTIKIVFFGESKEEYITVDALLTDLDLHGYKDILFPQEFVSNSDEYKVGIPIYSSNDLCDQVTFNIADDVVTFIFSIHDYNQSTHAFDYVGMNNIKTIIVSAQTKSGADS